MAAARQVRLRHGQVVTVLLLALVAGCSPGGGRAEPAPEPGTDATLGDDLDQALARRLDDCDPGDLRCEGDALDVFLGACLERHGFLQVKTEVEIGTERIEVYQTDAGGRVEELRSATDECHSRAYAMLPPGPVIDEAYYERFFDFLLDLKECLEGEGWTVPDPPSKEVWVESEGAVWHPYERMGALSGERLAALEAVCPQHPSDYHEW